jgi:hypothetical protein
LTSVGWATLIATAAGPWIAAFTVVGIDVVVFASVVATADDTVRPVSATVWLRAGSEVQR